MRSIKKIQADIAAVKSGLKSSSTPEKFKKDLADQLPVLEAELEEAKKDTKPDEEKPVKEVKRPVHNQQPASSSEYVKVDGQRFVKDSPELCQYLHNKYESRKKSLKKNFGHARKSGIFKIVSTKVGSGALKAIRNDMAVHRKDMDLHPEKYIARYKKLKAATKEYLRSFKLILGDKFRAAEIEQVEKEIDQLIDRLEKKVADNKK